jgi:hypothetical protein
VSVFVVRQAAITPRIRARIRSFGLILLLISPFHSFLSLLFFFFFFFLIERRIHQTAGVFGLARRHEESVAGRRAKIVRVQTTNGEFGNQPLPLLLQVYSLSFF